MNLRSTRCGTVTVCGSGARKRHSTSSAINNNCTKSSIKLPLIFRGPWITIYGGWNSFIILPKGSGGALADDEQLKVVFGITDVSCSADCRIYWNNFGSVCESQRNLLLSLRRKVDVSIHCNLWISYWMWIGSQFKKESTNSSNQIYWSLILVAEKVSEKWFLVPPEKVENYSEKRISIVLLKHLDSMISTNMQRICSFRWIVVHILIRGFCNISKLIISYALHVVETVWPSPMHVQMHRYLINGLLEHLLQCSTKRLFEFNISIRGNVRCAAYLTTKNGNKIIDAYCTS